MSHRVIDVLAAGSGGFAHGHTYQAHPVACPAALGVQRIIQEDDVVSNVRVMGYCLDTALRDRFGGHAHVGDIEGRGLFRAMEFVADRDGNRPFDPEHQVHERVKREALRRGPGIYPAGGTVDGIRSDYVLVAPPYIATAADIDEIVDRLGEAVDAVLTGL